MVERLLWEQDAAGSNPVIRTTQRELTHVVSSLCVSYYDIEYAAACEQSKELALGKMLVRCRWQKKDKHFGAAVDKIEEKRKPEDFIGHRKPATKPKMPQVRILSSGPKMQEWIYAVPAFFYKMSDPNNQMQRG